MSFGIAVRNRKDSKHFAEHATIGPESGTRLYRTPDRGPRRDRVDAAEHCIADLLAWSETVLDSNDFDGWVDFVDGLRRGKRFCPADFVFPITLRCRVGQVNVIEVDQLNSRCSDRRELQRDLATDCADADHRCGDFSQPVHRDQFALPFKTILDCVQPTASNKLSLQRSAADGAFSHQSDS